MDGVRGVIKRERVLLARMDRGTQDEVDGAVGLDG